MTLLDPIVTIPDSWYNSASGRTGTNYSGANRVQVQSGSRWGFLRPALPDLAGRTVLDAYLVGHAGNGGLVAQTLTVDPYTEGKSAGRVTYANRPAVNTSAGFSQAIPATAAGAEVVLDDPGLAAILQAVADGGDWYGIRLSTNHAADSQGFVATDSGEPAWELHIELEDVAEVPENLRPNGGKVGSTARTLAWEADGQTEFRVQLDTPALGAEPDDASPDYDSGWVTAEDWQHTVPAGPVFSTDEDAPTYWRAWSKVGTVESDPSDWAEFWTDTRPTLVIDSPTGPFGDVTPQVLAHLVGGTIKSWEILVTGPDRADVRHRKSGTGALDWTIPEKNAQGKRIFREDEVGQMRVTVTPEGDWVAAVGSPVALSTWIAADWDEDAGVSPVSNLTSYQIEAGSPIRVWSWERTEAADAFLVQVDGATVARLEDLAPTAGVYTFTDSGQVGPLRPRTLGVVAVEGTGSTAARSAATTITEVATTVNGLWIIPEDPDIDPIVLAGTSVGGFVRTDYRQTYVNSLGEEVDIFYGTPPRQAPFEGSVDNRDGDVWAQLDRVEALRKSKNRNAQLVWGSQSMRARIRDIDWTSADDLLPNTLTHVVRFNAVGLDD